MILPAWGDRKIDSITPEEGIRLLDGIMDQGHPAAAIRAHAVASKFFNWCVERRLLAASPFAHVKKPAQAVSRDRVLSDEELRLMWRAAERIGYPFGTFAQLLALTGQRRDEVAGMRRSEISGDLWTIPGSRTKNGSATEVPLSKAALVAIGSAPTVQMPAIIGPNGRKQSRGASDFVLTTTAETPISGYAKAKAQIDKTMLEIAKDEATKARRNDVDEIKVLPWRLHDLRRTLASGLARLGEPVHVVEAILNHRSGTISGVAAVYNRHSYLPEKRAALKRWAEHLSGITAGSG